MKKSVGILVMVGFVLNGSEARAQTAPDHGSLFVDDRGALVRLDVATGGRQVLLGGS